MKNRNLVNIILILFSTGVFAANTQTTPIGQNEVINITSSPTEVKPANTKSTVRLRHKKHKTHVRKEEVQSSSSYYLQNSTFDFSYNGDIAGITTALQQYDPTLKVLPSLGNVKAYPLNLDLQHTNLNSIQAFISAKTNQRVTLQYDQINNSIRLIFDSKITVANDAVKQSQIWQDGGTPTPVLDKNGLVLFPYGQYEPKVTCQPLQLCDIQLEGGEVVKGLMIGDSVRWNEGDGAIPIVYSGGDNKQVPHVVLKPSEAGLQTTLLITTDKRTYYIKLYSSDSVNVSRTGFYYPSEQLQQVENQRKSNENEANKDLSDNKVDPKDMHFNYKVSGDTDAPFNPVQIFDDGKHVYIQMPTGMSPKSLPAFYILGADGETLQIVNFRYKAPFYIVDTIFEKGVLLYGVDDNEQRITITRSDKKGFWSRLFGG